MTKPLSLWRLAIIVDKANKKWKRRIMPEGIIELLNTRLRRVGQFGVLAMRCACP
jgi:hypothetical protein